MVKNHGSVNENFTVDNCQIEKSGFQGKFLTSQEKYGFSKKLDLQILHTLTNLKDINLGQETNHGSVNEYFAVDNCREEVQGFQNETYSIFDFWWSPFALNS